MNQSAAPRTSARATQVLALVDLPATVGMSHLPWDMSCSGKVWELFLHVTELEA